MSRDSLAKVFTLARNDIKARFAGSYLGIFWAFVQPVVMVLVYWFVFTFGFRDGSGSEVPFVLFLTSGMVPWFYFSDALSGGTNTFLEYSYLVKKVVFNIEILPLVKLISSFFVHIFFVLVAIIMATAYGYYPGPWTLLVLYYMLCSFILVCGLSYLCSSVVIFFRDLSQFINIVVLQLGMWATPILWNADTMLFDHPTIHFVLKLNPMYYIVDGFRDAIIYQRFGLDEKWLWTIYFWLFALLMLLFGRFVFKRLRPHFADVL